MENVQNMENPVGSAPRADRDETVGGDPRAPRMVGRSPRDRRNETVGSALRADRNGWRTVRLGEICSHVCSGGTPKSGNTAFYDRGDIPWLNTKEVNFEDVYTTEKFITQEGYDNSAAKWVEPNSVIIAMYGATAGKSCITKIRLTTNQACCNMQIDDEQADYRFVFYMVRSHYEKLASLAVGGAQQNLSAQFLKDYSISLPPLPIQQRIAEILGAYDDAIENNRRRIALLEKMARELYRERFVRRARKGDAAFPLEKIAQFVRGKVIVKDATKPGEVPVVAGGLEPAYYHDTANTDAPVVTVSGSGANAGFARMYFEKVWASDCSWADAMSTKYIRFVYCFLKDNDAELRNAQKGAAQPHVHAKDVNGLQVKAEESAIAEFEKKVTPLFDEEANLTFQNRNLARQRDRLLPRLMSGRLEVGA